MNEVKWFAVLVEVKPEITDRYRDYGMGSSGDLWSIDLRNDDKCYSVVFKCGSSLHELAESKAKLFNGFVVEVTSDYMFNNSDIKL